MPLPIALIVVLLLLIPLAVGLAIGSRMKSMFTKLRYHLFERDLADEKVSSRWGIVLLGLTLLAAAATIAGVLSTEKSSATLPDTGLDAVVVLALGLVAIILAVGSFVTEKLNLAGFISFVISFAVIGGDLGEVNRSYPEVTYVLAAGLAVFALILLCIYRIEQPGRFWTWPFAVLVVAVLLWGLYGFVVIW